MDSYQLLCMKVNSLERRIEKLEKKKVVSKDDTTKKKGKK